MSDIPNPFAALDTLGPRLKDKSKKIKLSPFKKLLPKKLAKKLFGKKFATKTRNQLTSVEEVVKSRSLVSKLPGLVIPVKLKKHNVYATKYLLKKWALI